MSFDTIANSRFLIRALTFLGLWPVVIGNGGGSWFKRYYRCYQLFLHITLTFTLSLLMWLDVIFSDNLDHATQVLKFLLTEMSLVLKIFNIWHYSLKAAGLLHEWQMSELFVLQTVGEQEMWRCAQRAFHKVVIFYVGCSFNAAICAFVAVPFMNTRELPFPFWLPRKWREDYYWAMYFYEFIAMPFTCLCNIQIDLFLSYFLLHLTLCLRVIGKRLERLGNATEDDAVTKEFVKIMKMHQRVIDMSKRCVQMVSLPVLMQIMLSSFIICFIIYRLQSVSFRENPAEYLAMLQYVVAMSMEIFLPCYYANELTVQSEKLSYHLYCCDWTGMSVYNRRMIFLYMEYLNQPLVLHAGQFFKIGLPIFSKTMNNAYSLLALLLRVSDDNKN
ncbi:PREDICTED: odorant receptor 94a-like [Rhagoletis zephyria]|uniref:odorant receptor 94a-like n=1 Tax=Rhagoletis zephyria TaxID=28612 RepID=UPI0008116C16|nr:PREDICTED: odorant receptor 94a-like [Rhagoletis zephyria]